jgi:hypothetical protein
VQAFLDELRHRTPTDAAGSDGDAPLQVVAHRVRALLVRGAPTD